VNVASYVGHGTVRSKAMGEDFRRRATQAELDKMKALVDEAMKAGALGLATGLEYDPGIYSAPEEIVELARVAARHGGRYISHVRSEDRAFWKAIDEIVAIGREAKLPVQVSHIKLAMRSLWGKADELIAKLDAARAAGVDVTADIYPYTYWQSTLAVMFPERNFEDRKAALFAVNELSTPAGLLLSAFGPDPSYIGKTIADVSKLRRTPPEQTLMDLIREAAAWRKNNPDDEDRAEGVIGTSMEERDIERIMRWPHVNFCSDGELAGRHPRGFGSFPRVLGRYVRERKVLPLEEAVRKMTSGAAAHMGFNAIGTIAVGKRADLVLFDPNTVIDRATTAEPLLTSTGIQTVWVNGRIVYHDGKPTGDHPGKVLRRAQS
jgi:N-acyl-D-amino-acid deacylase